MSIGSLNRTVVLISRLLDRGNATVPFVKPYTEKPAFSQATGVPWPVATPESQGLDSDRIAAFFEALRQEPSLNMHSVLVFRGGRLLARGEFGDWDSHMWKATFSACKSIVSLAVGILVDEGRLAVSDAVTDFFEEYMNPLLRRKWRELTVEHLLTMRSGCGFNEAAAMSEENWVKAFFNAATVGKIGVTFQYNSLNTYMLAAIVTVVTGQSVSAFLRERLFDPLGMGKVYWETCPRGIEKGGWGLYIAPEDLAKLGQLVMQCGRFNGRQLVSENWIDVATAGHVEAPENYGDYTYGYQFWAGKGQPRFLMNGMLGQNVMGFWNNGVLLVSHAGNDELFQSSRYFALAHEAFGGEFPATRPENPAAVRRLNRTLAGLKTPAESRRPRWAFWKSAAQPIPAFCRELDGVTLCAESARDTAAMGLLPVSLQAIENTYTAGFHSLKIEVREERMWVRYRERDGVHEFPVGLWEPARTELTFGRDRYLMSVRGRCSADEEDRPVLLIQLNFLETPYTRRLKLTKIGEGIYRLEPSETPGENFAWMLVEGVRTDVGRQQPLIGTAIQKLDLDYVRYKVERLFRPSVTLRAGRPANE